ncbi:MAG: helix-turn-helix domain-containing protein [Bdellovibrionota bacterium]
MSFGERVERVSLESRFEGTDWLNVEEAASYLRIISRNGRPCSARVRNLVNQGRIPFYKPYGRLLFKKSELQRLIESSRKGEIRCQ